MASQDDYDDIDEDDNDEADLDAAEDTPAIKRARQAAKGKARAERERDEAKRELAFIRAGVDPEDPAAKYFVKGYDGPLTKDAIVAEATAAGVLKTVTSSESTDSQANATATTANSTDAQVSTSEAQGTAERQRLAANSSPDQIPPADPYEMAKTEARRDLANGLKEEHAIANGISTLATAAANGDQRVIWSPEKHQRLARNER